MSSGDNSVNRKVEKLYKILQDLGRVVIAFSGGVDSTFLAVAAKKVLGDSIVAVTAVSESLSARDQQEAKSLAIDLGIKHIMFPSNELSNPHFTANTAERCYFCKKDRFTALVLWAKERGINWIVEGTNFDDANDYRPGMRAVAELGVIKSPLTEAGLTKAEIRVVSKMWGLSTWNKLSTACLVSRLSYGQNITIEKLHQVEKAEELVQNFCTKQIRVRHHGNLARIEVATEEIGKLTQPGVANQLAQGLKILGFNFVTLDLQGYRTGSMNESLTKKLS